MVGARVERFARRVVDRDQVVLAEAHRAERTDGDRRTRDPRTGALVAVHDRILLSLVYVSGQCVIRG
jgi:hypothetical protein